jgi:hypothetical protein
VRQVYIFDFFFVFFFKLSIINKCFIYWKFWGFFCKIPLFLGDFVLPVGFFFFFFFKFI